MIRRERVVYTEPISNIRPIFWRGQQVASHYETIARIVEQELGQAEARLFTRPSIPDRIERGGDARWLTSHASSPHPLTQLPPDQQEAYSQNLSAMIGRIVALARNFRESTDPDKQELGDVLELAIEIPGFDYVLVENETLLLVAWGFRKAQASEQRDFRLVTALDATEDQGIRGRRPKAEIDRAEDDESNERPPTHGEDEQPPSARRRHAYVALALGCLALIMLIALVLLWTRDGHLPDEPGLANAEPERYGEYESDPLGRTVVKGQLLVVFEPSADVRHLIERHGGRWADKGITVVGYRPEMGLVQVDFDGDLQETQSFLKQLEFVEEVSLVPVHRLNAYSPSDPGFEQRDTHAWGYYAVNAFDAWDNSQGDNGVTIAVIDSGFAPDHPELSRASVRGYDVLANQPGLPELGDEEEPHGTHVAATVGGSIDNGAGVAGICPKCSLLLVNAGRDGDFTLSALINGLQVAKEKGADVVNMSLGVEVPPDVDVAEVVEATRGPEKVWSRALDYLEDNGVVAVASAGNSAMPARVSPQNRVESTLVVGAVNDDKEPASFSNYGNVVDISAPGTEIYSAVSDGGFGNMSGTSMAAPFVAGAAGLILAAKPNLPPQAVRRKLTTTAAGLEGVPGPDVGPLLNVSAALSGSTDSEEPPSQEAPTDCRCEDLRRRIEELERRVRDLEEGESSDDLTIPDEPSTDMDFAEGVWWARYDRQGQPLVRKRDSTEVRLKFQIPTSGEGTITYVEPEGKCTAPLSVELQERTLVMEQLEGAPCDHRDGGYVRYRFSCGPQEGDKATCTGRSIDGSDSSATRFYMESE